jgi:O-antigen ligase
MPDLKAYRTVTGKIAFAFALLSAFCLPLYKTFPVYTVFIWLLAMLAGMDFRHIRRNRSVLFLLLLVLSFYFLHVAGLLFSENRSSAWFDLQVKLPLFLMPLIMFWRTETMSRKSHYIGLAFVSGNLLASFVCLIAATWRSIIFTESGWTFDAELMDHDYTFWQMLMHGGNNFTYVALSVFRHPGYFSMYIVVSMLIITDYLINGQIGKTMKSRILFILLLLFFAIMVYLLFSRAGLLAMVAGMGFYLFVMMIRSLHRLKFLVLTAVFALTAFFLVSSNARMVNSWNELKSFVNGPRENLRTDSRLLIWYHAAVLLKENPWGAGTGDGKDVLLKMYENKGLTAALESKLNVHNQFLETGIQLGFPGLLLLVMLFVFPLVFAVRKRNWLLIAFLMVNGIFLLFESALNTQAGTFYFGFMLSFLLFIRPLQFNSSSASDVV